MDKRRTRELAVMGIMMGMGVLGLGWSSINMSLAAIQNDLSASVLDLQWMMNAYGIAICIPLLAVGKLGDSQGRKKYYLAGLVGLGIACLGAALSPSPGWLIASMALFGISAASILTLSQALTVHQYPESEKSKAVAIWATFSSMSLAAGPIFGGIVLATLNWRWIFFIEIPIILAAVILVAIYVGKEERLSSHCDWSGVGLLALIVGSAVTAIMQGPTWGWDWKTIGLCSVFFAASWMFLWVEKKSKGALFRPDLFSHPSFLFSSICNGCLVGFIWGAFFFIPLFLQNEEGISPLETGITMLLITLPVVIFSVPVSKLYEKWGAKFLMSFGFALLAISSFSHRFLPIWLYCLLIGCGWVLAWGPSAARALSSLPHKMAGIASGMFMTAQEIGGVVGLASAGAIFRIGTSRHLAPEIEWIEAVLGDKTTAWLSNPKAASELLDPKSPIIRFLHEGFQTGFSDALWFLAALMLIAFALSLCLPKELPRK